MNEQLNELWRLTEELNNLSRLYHVDGISAISDAEYDAKYQTLKQLEIKLGVTPNPNSPTQRIGESVSKSSKLTEEHSMAMLSLGNVFTNNELYQFIANTQKTLDAIVDWVAEVKYDGVAINLRYVNNELKTMTTRGNGYIGLTVSLNPNVTVVGIPDRITIGESRDIVHVRGELIMTYADFNNANEQRIMHGLEPFKHPRNAVVGVINNRDLSNPVNYTLVFIPYECFIVGKPKHFKNHMSKMQLLKAAGFSAVDTIPRIVSSIPSRLIDYYWRHHRRAAEIDVPMDGVVIKLNSMEDQTIMGDGNREPKWAIAFKYPSTSMPTTITDVEWTISRHGTLTPVAKLNPVTVGGALISSVSLHNPGYLEELKLHLGDTVTVIRSGEVIPKITSVDHSKRIANSPQFTTPTHCPSCNSELERIRASLLVCNSVGLNTCRAQMLATLTHYVSAEVMDIKGLGDATLETLFDAGIITQPSDLHKLGDHRERLIVLPNFGETKVNELIESIESTKEIDYVKFILSLGIPGIARATSVTLARAFPTIQLLMHASQEELMCLPGIGKRVANSISLYFRTKSKREDVLRRIENGVVWKTEELLPSTLGGTIWVFTGRLKSMKRKEAMKLIQSKGGMTQSTVTALTDFLVVGERPTLSKLNHYKGSRFKQLSEEEFIKKMSEE